MVRFCSVDAMLFSVEKKWKNFVDLWEILDEVNLISISEYIAVGLYNYCSLLENKVEW